MEKLKASAQKVQDYLEARGIAIRVQQLPDSTRTAMEAAAAAGCEVKQIAKSLVFRDEDSGEAVLVIASGPNRVDTGRIEAETGRRLGRADADFVREQTGFAIGGVPPVAHPKPLYTILDQDLRNLDKVWAAAGTPNAIFEIKPGAIQSLTSGTWLHIAEEKS